MFDADGEMMRVFKTGAIFEHESHDRLDRIFPAHRRDFGTGLAGERLQLFASETREQDPIGRAGQQIEILPFIRGCANRVGDLLASGRILEALVSSFAPTVKNPWWH